MRLDWKHIAISILGTVVLLVGYVYTSDKMAQADVNSKQYMTNQDFEGKINQILQTQSAVSENLKNLSNQQSNTNAILQSIQGSVSRLENRLK